MVDISDEYPNQQKNRSHRWLEIAVPFFSFGGAFIAILFPILGIPLDFHVPAMGCVLASCFLAYLAWIRPRKDIVALTTPIYSVIFFSFPIDYSTALVLQVLYAVSLTLMLVRLKYRFGQPGTPATLGKELGGTLKTYIEQTRDAFGDISPEAAHRAAVIFVRFAEGNYDDAIQSSKDILNDGENPDYVSPLIRAFSIIREHLTINNQSLPHPVTYLKFSENDTPLLAKPTVPADDEDMEFYTALDNALLLLYSVAWNNSERDRAHLLVCQVFAQKLMSST